MESLTAQDGAARLSSHPKYPGSTLPLELSFRPMPTSAGPDPRIPRAALLTMVCAALQKLSIGHGNYIHSIKISLGPGRQLGEARLGRKGWGAGRDVKVGGKAGLAGGPLQHPAARPHRPQARTCPAGLCAQAGNAPTSPQPVSSAVCCWSQQPGGSSQHWPVVAHTQSQWVTFIAIQPIVFPS